MNYFSASGRIIALSLKREANMSFAGVFRWLHIRWLRWEISNHQAMLNRYDRERKDLLSCAAVTRADMARLEDELRGMQ